MYNNKKAACGTYQKNDLTNLTPVQIIARLYQALNLDLALAQKAIIINDQATKGKKISHALAIIGELQANLNLKEGGEIAANLDDLYSYLTTEISAANIHSDSGGLDNAIKTIKPLTEAWNELGKQTNTRKAPPGGAHPTGTSAAVAFQATF